MKVKRMRGLSRRLLIGGAASMAAMLPLESQAWFRGIQNYLSFALPGSPVAVYSLAKMTGWAGSCIRVVRASDSAEQDIGFANNYLDVVAAASFRGASSLKVKTFYDQSGNGNDATQATAANQPQLLPGDTLFGLQSILLFNPTYFDLPASVAVDRANFSAFMVGRTMNGTSSAGLYQLGTSTPYAPGVFVTATFRINSGAGSVQITSEVPYDVRVYSSISGATNVFMINETSSSLTAATSAALTGGMIGKASAAGISNFPITECQAFVVYASALSPGNATSVRSALYTAFNVASAATGLIAWDGDSITIGTFNNKKVYIDNSLALLRTRCRAVNSALSGETLATMVTNGAAQIDVYFNAGNSKNICHMLGGTNDIGTNASTGAQTYALLQTYCANRRSAGWKVVVATLPARNGSMTNGQTAANFEIERQSFNSLVRTNWQSFADGLADMGMDPIMGNVANAGNTTYFHDGTHPTDTGNAIIAVYAANAVNPLL